MLNERSREERAGLLDALAREIGPYEGDRLLMGWEEIRRLQEEGFEIGSHTVSHTPLTDLGPSEARREIGDSKHRIAREIQVPVQGFSYPRGQFRPEHETMARRAGYRYAVSTRYGSNGPGSNPFALARRTMSDYQGVRSLFPVPMHMLELSGRLDAVLSKRRN
jgi:peptidoglycan/xylan/chitin deacetylase (PgdA/CDA1 family)